MDKNRELGHIIGHLLAKENLDRKTSYEAFKMVLADEVTEMQQGAFLAALTAKGETAEEVAGGWQAVYDLDTNKVDLSGIKIVDNCGTGMDTFKTFNISTASSLVASGGGVKVARHGARAITSSCGTVDMAELLGVDMECSADLVAQSVEVAGIGLFNGMSPEVHPMALGRILSQIRFGSPLNIAASLAHPAMPRIAVRGVYSPTLLQPVAEVMREIGYTNGMVVYGEIDKSSKGMDEASVCGTTRCVEFNEDSMQEFTLRPEALNLSCHDPASLAADSDRHQGAVKMYHLLSGKGDKGRSDAVILNSALIFYVEGSVATIEDGVEKARDLLFSGVALETLHRWVEVQNRHPERGMEKLETLRREGGKS